MSLQVVSRITPRCEWGSLCGSVSSVVRKRLRRYEAVPAAQFPSRLHLLPHDSHSTVPAESAPRADRYADAPEKRISSLSPLATECVQTCTPAARFPVRSPSLG